MELGSRSPPRCWRGPVLSFALAHIRQIMNINIALGTRLPASATSMGRVHLSRLDPNEVVRRLEFPLLPFTPHTVPDQEAVPGAS